jgi:hypothetical protein
VKTLHINGHLSSMVHIEPLSLICQATGQTLRIDKSTPVLRLRLAHTGTNPHVRQNMRGSGGSSPHHPIHVNFKLGVT